MSDLGVPCVHPYEVLRREPARFVLGFGTVAA